MSPRFFFTLLCASTLFAATPTPRTLTLNGTLTNTTVDVAGPSRLTLTITGDTATAVLKTEKPLTGSGKLEGHFRNGWLELTGKLDAGFTLQLRGALNSRDFRGTYLASIPGEPVQYGKFHLTLEK